jgi:hypothetical protein
MAMGKRLSVTGSSAVVRREARTSWHVLYDLWRGRTSAVLEEEACAGDGQCYQYEVFPRCCWVRWVQGQIIRLK